MNFDYLPLGQRSRIETQITTLSERWWLEVRSALLIATGFDDI